MKLSISCLRIWQASNSVISQQRDVVLGRNSKVWLDLAEHVRVTGKNFVSIGHAELEQFVFDPSDRVWVFSYSRNPVENQRLISRLAAAKVQQIVYISSSSVRVASMTQCYEYPRVKLAAQKQVQQIANAKVLTLGLVYSHENELPAGTNIATHITELASFMVSPDWSDTGDQKNLFQAVDRPFKNGLEKLAFDFYGLLITASRSYPCLLRPLDLVLKQMGMRWYGYTFLSNRLWISTT
jgi:hypothetical protein